MELNSAFFLFCFFPALLILYAAIPSRGWRNALLCIAGLVFYSFGSLFDLILLVAAAFVNFCVGLALRSDRARRLTLAAGVGLNLLVLVSFKLLERLTVTVSGPDGVLYVLFARRSPVTLAIPLGLSFYTFKCISYLIDIYRDKSRSAGSFWRLLMYVSFFPQLLSGPITRFSEFAPQLDGRNFSAGGAARGLRRLIRGLAKKLLIAASVGKAADAVFALGSAQLDIRLAWLGAAAYALQLFFDFSGYSDMAIGLGQVFGFETPENFNFPYVCASVTEFWRRWHISLSSWFKDYVYIPLGGNRRGKYRTAVNKLIVFALCGLWHGTGLTFLLWGVWHGLLSGLESLGAIDAKRLCRTAAGRAVSHCYALLAVMLGFVMFRAASVSSGLAVLGAMFTGFRLSPGGTVLLYSLLDAKTVFMFILGGLLSVPAAKRLGERLDAKRFEGVANLLYLLLFVLCVTQLAAGGFAPFIYSQF